jgi:carbonic anhydrase
VALPHPKALGETAHVQKLIQGIHRFQSDVFAVRQDFFRRLVDGQRPQALFITCSDSRMVPDMICQTDPGDLFVIRNAGNIVPPYTPGVPAGEAATIEYAIRGLGIKDIIVCGHTRCGAMQATLNPDSVAEMPRVRQWLANADASAEIVCTCYHHLADDAKWNVITQENVLVQLEHLRTHPAVLTGLAAGELRLHAWVYKMETGDVFAYDPESGQFTPLVRGESRAELLPANRNGTGALRGASPAVTRTAI